MVVLLQKNKDEKMKRKKEKQSKGWLTLTILVGIMMIIPQFIWCIDISDGYVYSTNSSGHNPQVITGFNFDPQIYYYSGAHNRTYFLWMQKGGWGYSHENMIFYYDHDTEELSSSFGVGVGTLGATDVHGHGAMIVADDGHIIVVHEQLRNTSSSAHNGPYQMKRSNEPEDPSSGFTLVHTTGSGNCYPKLWKTANGDLFVSSRYGSDAWNNHYRIKFFKSTDNGQTWDGGTVVINFGTSANYWAYHLRIHQSDSDGINIVVDRVDRDPYYEYPDCYYVRSDDGVIWRNIDNSFSKNVDTQGAINCTEMDTYCLIEHSDDDGGCVPITTGCFSPGGNLYLIEFDSNRLSSTNPAYWYFRYWENDEWQKVDISEIIPDDFFASGNKMEAIYSYSDTKFDLYVVCDRTGSGIHEIERWQTLDKGLTWNLVEDITSNSDYDHVYTAFTENISDSPYLALSNSYLNNSNCADVFILARGNPIVAVDEQILPSKTNVILHQNNPNPFSDKGETTISYTLPKSSNVYLSIYNLKGQLLETLVNGIQQAGNHSIVWTPKGDIGSGLYFYRITAGHCSATKKCVILK